MIGGRKLARAHLAGIGRDRGLAIAAQMRIPLDEFRLERGEQPQHVIDHEDLPVAARRGADADGRDRDPGGDPVRERRGHLFQNDRERACLIHRAGIGQQRLGGIAAALHLVAAKRVDRLRRQPDMRHHRHAARHQKRDGFGHVPPAFQLDRRSACLGHQMCCAAKCLFGAFLVAAERHVDDQHRSGQPARHCAPVHHHHLHRHAQRRGQTVQHHAHTVADQHHIAMRVHHLRHGRGIGRQADNRGAALHRPDILGQRGGLVGRGAHCRVPVAWGLRALAIKAGKGNPPLCYRAPIMS